MAVNLDDYKSGESRIVADANASLIATRYIRANAESIGANQNHINSAVGITREIQEAGGFSSLEEYVTAVERRRAEAVEGKTGAELQNLNKTYDVLLGYYSALYEIRDHQRENPDRPYRFPSLSNRLAEGSQQHFAGDWRSAGDRALRQLDQQREEEQRGLMTPIDAAISEMEDTITSRHGGVSAVRRAIQTALENAQSDGVSEAQLWRNVTAQLEQGDDNKSYWFTTSIEDTAQEVVARAKEISDLNPDSRSIIDEPEVGTEEEEQAAAADNGGAGSEAEAGGADDLTLGEVLARITQFQPGDRQFVPIDASIQADLEALGLNTGQPGGPNPNRPVEEFDGKNGGYTSQAIADFLRSIELDPAAGLTAAARQRLAELAEERRNQLAAGTATPNQALATAIEAAGQVFGEAGQSGILSDSVVEESEIAGVVEALRVILEQLPEGAQVGANEQQSIANLLSRIAPPDNSVSYSATDEQLEPVNQLLTDIGSRAGIAR